MTTIESVGDLLTFLETSLAPTDDYWFRGHASNEWDLSASVFRTIQRETNEIVLLKRFMQEAHRHDLPSLPQDPWDWILLAQHYQVPTRLLDWSESALVGLYFASLDHLDVTADPRTARDGCVWVLQPTVLNEKQGLAFRGRDIPLFGVDEVLNEYNPLGGVPHSRPPVAGLAMRSFKRIAAQWGTFTVSNRSRPIELEADASAFLQRLEIPLAAKPDIRQQLARLGVDDRSIYVDLFRLGRDLGERYG